MSGSRLSFTMPAGHADRVRTRHAALLRAVEAAFAAEAQLFSDVGWPDPPPMGDVEAWVDYGRAIGLTHDNLTLGEVRGAVLAKLKLARVEAGIKAGIASRGESGPQYVTLDQISAIAGHRGKSALEKKLRAKNSTMPQPDIEGGGGKAHNWKWSTIRPWLMREYPNRQFPEVYPVIR